MKCHQCQKPVFYDLEDVVACLDCYYKIVQINNIRFLQAAAMANQALDDMDMELNGDVFTIETGYEEVHIFWNH